MKHVIVLLAEDDVKMRRNLATHLRTYGIKIIEVGDGQEALDLVRAGLKFDILITDYQMPRIDGIQLVQILRQEGHRQPMILWTAWVPLPACDEADAVVSKMNGLPFVAAEVSRLLKRCP